MKNKCTLPPRQQVLVLLHTDGYAEAFGLDNLDVHILRVPYATSEAGKRVIDEHLELLLPERFRHLYWPCHLRAASDCRPQLLKDLQQRDYDLQLLRALNELEQRRQAKTRVMRL